MLQSSTGGNAVGIGGGSIQMECAASLVINKLNVTVVFQRPIAVSDVLNTFIYSIFSFELLIERL